jgi:hypothetical protein
LGCSGPTFTIKPNNMKRILLALTIIGCLLPLAPRAQAQTDVSLNFFYDNLSGQGNWIEVGDYGYCFQPNVAVSNSDWRPYSDGYWAYTDVGWTWVSYEDFGWATYHYGRWTNLENYGWLWVPGYEWGPAWVSWRTGGDYIGWAPLPPSGHTVYQGQAITGGVDVEFGIGPLYYNFVDIRYVGEPVLRGRILAPSRNVTIINQTVNVTNITYSNSTVYNYGPDYNRLNQYSTRPIQRLSLQRETSVGANFGQGQKGNFNRVSGNQLTVVAPTIQKSQQQIAPKQVKAKVQQPKVERGWQGVQNRQQLEAEMKQNNRQKIAPPSFQPQKERKREPVPGAEKTADRETQAPAEPKQNAGSDTDARDQQAQQSDQTAQGTEAQRNRQQNPNRKNRRGEPGAAQENATQQGGQEADRQSGNQADQSADREQKPDRQQQAERRAQRKDRDEQDTTPAERNQAPDRNQGADRNQSVDGNNRSDRAQNPRKAQPAERQQQPDVNTPDENRSQRREKADGAPRTRPADRDEQSSRSNTAQPSSRPERSQRPQQNRRPEQARPQEKPQQGGNENPDNQRKNKKKKPDADQPPQG